VACRPHRLRRLNLSADETYSKYASPAPHDSSSRTRFSFVSAQPTYYYSRNTPPATLHYHSAPTRIALLPQISAQKLIALEEAADEAREVRALYPVIHTAESAPWPRCARESQTRGDTVFIIAVAIETRRLCADCLRACCVCGRARVADQRE
jgi:hypothetical protein